MIVHGIINDDTRVLTNYPFLDTSNMTSDSGVFIPPDVFVDACIYITSEDYRVYIAEINKTPNRLRIDVRDFSGSLMRAEYIFGDSIELDYKMFSFLVLFNENGDEAGVIGVNVLKLLSHLNHSNVLTFGYSNTAFTPSALVPLKAPSSGITKVTSQNKSVSGVVWLIGENGVVLDYENNKLRVNAVGDFLYRRGTSQDPDYPETYDTRRPLKQLKVVGHGPSVTREVELTPDEFGNLIFSPLINRTDTANIDSHIADLDKPMTHDNLPVIRRTALDNTIRINRNKDREHSVELFIIGNFQ